MKKMDYQKASTLALRKFCWAIGLMPHAIEDGAQFRQLTVLESSGTSKNLTYVLFELQFCSKDGDNYRRVMIRVRNSEMGMDAELDTHTLEEVK